MCHNTVCWTPWQGFLCPWSLSQKAIVKAIVKPVILGYSWIVTSHSNHPKQLLDDSLLFILGSSLGAFILALVIAGQLLISELSHPSCNGSIPPQDILSLPEASRCMV